jgi:hypothetical protein
MSRHDGYPRMRKLTFADAGCNEFMCLKQPSRARVLVIGPFVKLGGRKDKDPLGSYQISV